MPKSTRRAAERVRLQIEADAHLTETIDRLTEEIGSASRAETVRRAVEIYDILVEEVGRDGRVVFEGPTGKRSELVLTGLRRSRKLTA